MLVKPMKRLDVAVISDKQKAGVKSLTHRLVHPALHTGKPAAARKATTISSRVADDQAAMPHV